MQSQKPILNTNQAPNRHTIQIRRSTNQVRLEKAEPQPKAFRFVFQKSDGQLEIHQSLLLDQVAG